MSETHAQSMRVEVCAYLDCVMSECGFYLGIGGLVGWLLQKRAQPVKGRPLGMSDHVVSSYMYAYKKKKECEQN